MNQLQTIVWVRQGRFDQVLENRGEEERIVMVVDIAVVVRTEVGTGHLGDQKRAVEKYKAVGKLPQAANKALVKMIHNPHLVKHHKRLVEDQNMEQHSLRWCQQ